jgi:hypothetical protein
MKINKNLSEIKKKLSSSQPVINLQQPEASKSICENSEYMVVQSPSIMDDKKDDGDDSHDENEIPM